jgi:bifunctional non-homologous end joining protein LigD
MAKTKNPRTTPRRTTGKANRIDVGGISLSSPDRVVYPELGITKLELARYYEAAFDRLLPHFRDRPLTLVRCPDNYHKCFFQKHIDDNPVYEHLHRIPIKEEKGIGYYCAADSLEGVLSLVQLGVVEFHTWASRRDKLEYPDKFTLDLDPDPTVSWGRVVRAALAIRQLLQEIGLRSFAKTTGGKGLHVVVPIARRRTWDDVHAFTEAIAGMLVEAAPKEYVMTVSKAKRRGKILIDYLRNARGAIAVEAYSARAREGATVSMPITWDELTPKLDPQRFNVRTAGERLDDADPWAEYSRVKQSITAQMMKRVGAA